MTSAQQVWELSRAVLADQDGVVAVLKAYMDESGTHAGSPVVTVGLYVGKPSYWQAWTKDWNANKRPIKVYHAVDAHNRKGEFEGWDRPKRNAFVANLLPVLARHPIMGIAVGIDMVAFRKAMKPHPELRAMFGTPYAACFQWTVQLLLTMMDEQRDTQRVAFFHECNDDEEDAKTAFAYVKAQRNLSTRPISLTFGGKNDYVPLQAADVLAYEANHLLRDPSKPTRLPWEALNPGSADPKKNRVLLLQYGGNNIGDLIAKLGDLRTKLIASGWDGKVGP